MTELHHHHLWLQKITLGVKTMRVNIHSIYSYSLSTTWKVMKSAILQHISFLFLFCFQHIITQGTTEWGILIQTRAVMDTMDMRKTMVHTTTPIIRIPLRKDCISMHEMKTFLHVRLDILFVAFYLWENIILTCMLTKRTIIFSVFHGLNMLADLAYTMQYNNQQLLGNCEPGRRL